MIERLVEFLRERPVVHDYRDQIGILSRLCRSTAPARRDRHRVLFVHMRGSAYLMAFEAVLVNRLRLEGIEPTYLSCCTLPICNNQRFFAFRQDQRHLCAECIIRNREYAALSQCEMRMLADFESDPGLRERAARATRNLSLSQCIEFSWNGVPLGGLCEVSASRFLCRDVRNIVSASDTWYFRQFLESGVILTDLIEKALDRLMPTVIVQNSGRFFWHAIVDYLARRRAIGVVSYEGDGGFGHAWSVRAKVPVSSLEIGEIWSPESTIALSSDKDRQLESTLAQRRSGAMVKGFPDSSAFSFDGSLPADLFAACRPVIALFTNLTFDSQVAARHTIFSGVVDWLKFTIQEVAPHANAVFVIRVHPAEIQEHEGDYSRERIIDELRDKGVAIPENVVIIPPWERMNSYELADRSLLSVVYTSTIGLELLARGKKVVICGRAHYANKGFGCAPASREEYTAILLGAERITQPTDCEVKMARSYAYTFWHEASIPLRVFTTNGRFQVDQLLLKEPRQIARGVNPSLDKVIDMILSESEVTLTRCR